MRRSCPDLPGRTLAGPEIVELDGVLVGVHALPEACVPEGPKLVVVGQALERLALEHAGVGKVVKDAGVEAEEAAVDPVLGPGLLVEPGDPAVTVELGDAELELGTYDRHRGQCSVCAVKSGQLGEVDVRQAVRVCCAERGLPHAVANPCDAPARGRLHPGVDALDVDRLGPFRLGHELLDLLAEVTGAQHETAQPLRGEDAHHVPEDRPPAYLDQRLGKGARVLLQAGPPPTTENDDALDGCRAHSRVLSRYCPSMPPLAPPAPGLRVRRGPA